MADGSWIKRTKRLVHRAVREGGGGGVGNGLDIHIRVQVLFMFANIFAFVTACSSLFIYRSYTQLNIVCLTGFQKFHLASNWDSEPVPPPLSYPFECECECYSQNVWRIKISLELLQFVNFAVH